MDTCRILMAQPLSKEDISYFENEAQKGGVEIQETKKIESSSREVERHLKEVENGSRKYNVVILQQSMGMEKKVVTAKELEKYKRISPGLKILLCVSDDTHGTSYLKEIFDAGIYTAFFEKDGTIKNLVELLKSGRSAKAAISYYGISPSEATLNKVLGYMDKTRLAKQVNLIHAANEDTIVNVLQHLRKMLAPKELLFVLQHLEEEDLQKVFFQRGMAIFFDKARYNIDSEENTGFLAKILKQENNLSLSDYIISPDTLEARMGLIKLQNEQKKEKKQHSKKIHEEVIEENEREEEEIEEIENIDKNDMLDDDIAGVKEHHEETQVDSRADESSVTETTTENSTDSFFEKNPLEQLEIILKGDISQSILEKMAAMIEQEVANKSNVNFSPVSIKSERKRPKKYCVAAGNKHAGATFVASVLAHTYKNIYPEQKVCVFSFQDGLAKFAEIIGLGTDNLPEKKITFQNVDYLVGRKSEITEYLYDEYDAIFIDYKNVPAIGKNVNDPIFVVTQGDQNNIVELRETAEFIKEHDILDVTLLVNIKPFEQTEKNEVGKMLAWKEEYDFPYLKSATRGLNDFEIFFVKGDEC